MVRIIYSYIVQRLKISVIRQIYSNLLLRSILGFNIISVGDETTIDFSALSLRRLYPHPFISSVPQRGGIFSFFALKRMSEGR